MPDRPNIVLFTVESLRTDHVGAYGGRSRSRPEIPVTPNLDAFAGEAVVYDDAHAVTSWTLASHASLFTGLYPSAHQTRRPRSRLGYDYDTLAERLAAAGYQTAGVVSGPYLRTGYQLSQGFELYDDSIASPLQVEAHSDVTNPRMEAALARFLEEQRDPGRPFFLFGYFWDTHFDFLPPEPYDTLFLGPECEKFDISHFHTNDSIHAGITPGQLAYLYSQYAGEVRATDDVLGRLFTRLREQGLWDDTWIIVTADHGEEFFDHGQKGHKNNLYAETVKVPLLIKYPAGVGPAPGTRDARLVSLVDILPSVLELARIGPDAALHGTSLLSPPVPERAIFYELLSLWYFEPKGGEDEEQATTWVGVRRGSHKLIASNRIDEDGKVLAATTQLFDVALDPLERENLAGRAPRALARLGRLAASFQERSRSEAKRYRAGGELALSEAEREQLRALGYLDD